MWAWAGWKIFNEPGCNWKLHKFNTWSLPNCCSVLREPIEISRISCTDKSQECFSVDSHFIIIQKTGLCLFCFRDHVKLAQNRWVLSPCQAFFFSMGAVCMCVLCACECVRAGQRDRFFSSADLLLHVCVCVCGQLQLRCMHKSVFPLWLSSCPAVVYAVACMCVCAGLCVCSGVQMSWGWCPASNKGFCRAKWRGGQPGDWQSHEVGVGACVIMNVCGFGQQMVLMVCYIPCPKFQI